MPFLAIKMDSSFLFSNTITKRTIKNTTEVNDNHFDDVALYCCAFSQLSLIEIVLLPICQGYSKELIQAKTIITTPNPLGMP